jgi:hypothetical protein
MQDTDSFFVRICNCGVVHLCFGPTTLNVSEQTVIAITATLKEVSQELISLGRIQTKKPEPVHAKETSLNVIQGHFGSELQDTI